MSIEYSIYKLNISITGWVNYFALADMKGTAAKLEEWIRMCFCKQ